jgi:ribonuclease HII
VAISDSLFSFDLGQDAQYVCGADEAGRACMAGPLVVAAVRFDYARLDADAFARLADLNDSKKLSSRRRAALLPIVFEVADMAVSVVIPAGQIDRDGLDVSNIRALGRALEAVAVAGSENLVDWFELKSVGVFSRSVEHGDQTSAAIAAASIVAKETRDWLMRRLDVDYPGYGFAVHKGYITRGHEAAVVKLGLSPAHRRSVNCKAYAALGLKAEAATPKPKKTKKAPEWKSLPDAEKAQYLLDHQTLSDRTWTDELRLKGEKRDAFIRRILLGEVLHGEAVESDETETVEETETA